MASVINTNNASLIAQRNLSTSQTDLTQSVQRLSSGLRINSAKDDAAGLGISQKLQAQITGANVSARNANDAISMVQTAEGGMQEVSSMLQRMRELATQGNNDSLDATQRSYIATEIDALRSEVNQVATRTTFNGKGLLDGSIDAGTSQVGTSTTTTSSAATAGSVTFSATAFVAGDTITGSIGGVNFSAAFTTDSATTLAALNTALSNVSAGATAAFDGAGSSLKITQTTAGLSVNTATITNATVPTVGTAIDGTAAVTSTTYSVDYVAAASATGLQFQLGTDAGDDTNDIGSLFKNVSIDDDALGNFNSLDTGIDQIISSGTSDDFGDLTDLIDSAIDTISGYRSELGAMSNRLDSNIANLQVQAENLTASMSRIMDTDYAAETAALSKNQVMQQAATAMLAQANQMPNAVLSLLK
ncbi:MAG: flagellin [Hydrogenophaga sp.]|uniref:flagellin N-terminal helical domain-containing protein n=1 Tax=Hydrogenophaga sp. TaxID=1904254 RepID=UPI002623D161|nr:flagellin [Hydrogenophaga sp.]MDM7942396.1 flagellin [Hydrogenophaga sp.]